MNLKKKNIIICSIVLLLCISFFLGMFFAKRTEEKLVKGQDSVFFGNISLADFSIEYLGGKDGRKAIRELKKYIYIKTGEKLKNSNAPERQNHKITIAITEDAAKEKISLSQGNVTLYGTDSEDCVKTVRAFANMYLGFMFAGEDRQKTVSGDIHNPEDDLYNDTPWMEKREPIVCLWKTNVPRGQYYNPNANLNSEVLTYSDDMLYEYVKMMKACGFNGIQVTDMCSAWAQYSGYEFVHDRLRFMADAAHSLGMNFTLWVWGAEFDGYGWVDDSVVYSDPAKYKYSYECPSAYETFDKYYDIYAELADCSDRVIMHFDDPCKLDHSEEVATYAKLFRDKCREKNPSINFGISDYTDKYDKTIFADVLGQDVTVYAGAVTSDKSWTDFRMITNYLGLDLGVWSWNLCEMEIDQLAWMNVNSQLIKSVYLNTRADGDEAMKASYWSEMDSYHVANLFSLFCAGHLLQRPDDNSTSLLREVANRVVGPEYGDCLYELLTIIEDARTGKSWKEFRMGFDEYLLTSSKYPAKDILQRCEKYIPALERMIEAELPEPTIPLPISSKELLEMIRPHLYQIQKFAQFRVEYNKLKADITAMPEKEVIKRVCEIYEPIPTYDVLVGVWGQPEALAQYNLLNELDEIVDYELPQNKLYRHYLKQYIYQEICAYQKKNKDCLKYYLNSSLWSVVIGEDNLYSIMSELADEGLVTMESDEYVCLSNWENFR